MRKFIFIIFGAALALAAMLTVGNALAASQPQQTMRPDVVIGFDFEDGTLQGWQTLTDTSFITNVAGITYTLNNDPNVGYQSQRSLRLTITDTNVSTTTLGGAGVQTVTTGSAITGFVRISNINLFGGTYGGAAIVVLDANNAVHIGDIAPILVANQWVQASIVLTQPYPGPYSIGVGVLINHSAGNYNTNVWIDKVQWSDPVGGGTATVTAPPGTATATRTPTLPASTPTGAATSTLSASSTSAASSPTVAATGTIVASTATVTATRTVVASSPTAAATGTIIAGTPTLTATGTTVVGTPTISPTACTIRFTDVPTSNIFYDDIQFLACRGIVNGFPNGDGTFRFEPNSNMRRGEFAKVAVLAFNIQQLTSATPSFVDVPPSNIFYRYIEGAFAAGVISGLNAQQCAALGTPGRCYGPNVNITRGQAAKIVRLGRGLPVATPTTPTFSDVPPSNVFYQDIETLASLGIVSGAACPAPQTGQCYRPNDNIRRGELSKIVRRAIPLISGNRAVSCRRYNDPNRLA